MCFIPYFICLSLFKRDLGCGSVGSYKGERSLDELKCWEVNNVEDLFSRLQGEVVDSAGEDKVVWMNLRNDKFSIKYLYAALEMGGSISFPTNIIWNS